MKNTTRWRMSALACLMMIPLLGALGCTSEQEKATRVIQGAISECQKAEEPFAEIMAAVEETLSATEGVENVISVAGFSILQGTVAPNGAMAIASLDIQDITGLPEGQP